MVESQLRGPLIVDKGIMSMGRSGIRVCILILLLAGWGCGERVVMERETDETAYRRGKSYLKEGRKEEALEAFLSVIAKRLDAPESHLEAGLLYLDHIEDPISAIFHFRQFLAMKPGSEHAEFVEGLIIAAKKDFAESLPGQPFAGEVNKAELLAQVKELKTQNSSLKQSIAEMQLELDASEKQNAVLSQEIRRRVPEDQLARPLAPIVIQERPASEPSQAQGVRTYNVQSGDTLSRISQKMYGTPNRWSAIFQANRDVLPSPNALRPGQELKIPQ